KPHLTPCAVLMDSTHAQARQRCTLPRLTAKDMTYPPASPRSLLATASIARISVNMNLVETSRQPSNAPKSHSHQRQAARGETCYLGCYLELARLSCTP